MDLDVLGSHVRSLLAFKDKIEGLMNGADDHGARASDTLDELLAFKSEVQGVLPMLEKTVSDVSLVIADLGAIRGQLAPALAWIADQQKAAEAVKAAEARKVADAAKAQEHPEADKASVDTLPQVAAAEEVLGSQADHVDHPGS